jgi:hypothetical protein
VTRGPVIPIKVVRSLIVQTGPRHERRRFGGRLFRPDGARGENELDQDFAQQGLFTCFRLYGSYFDKTWMLADIEEVK